MSMFFNSWKDEDADAYWGCGDASGHYYRGYYDGQEDGRKENEGNLDKAYRKGFKAGRSKAVTELMKKLFELFGDEVDLAYLDVKTEQRRKKEEEHKKLQEQISNAIKDSVASIEDASDEPECYDSLDDMMPQDSLAEPEMTLEYNIDQDINDD